MEVVFLETTVQADRCFSPREDRKKIIDKLKEKKVISSTYVLGEFKASFLRDAIAFYNLLQQCDSTSIALNRLDRILYSKRQYSRVIKIFSHLTENGSMEKDEVKKRLNLLIEDLFESRFMKDISELLNSTNCYRARVQPYKEDELWKIDFECKQDPPPDCSICFFHKFFSEEIATISQLTDKSIQEIIGILNEIRIEGKRPYGKRCWKIGDVIIAFEVPKEAYLYTTNKKDFQPICNAIGKCILD